jgi:hypothetical protein
MASGDPGQLELLREELRRGPRGAAVSALDDVRTPATEPASQPFGILH